jgi:protein tyrosine/serine phosphatase
MSSLKISYALISVVGFLMPAMGWSGPHDRLGSITRFHEVTEGVYRGSAPLNLDVDLALLKDLGVKTVINLQGEANERPQVEAERRVAKNLGIRLLHYGMPSAWTSLGRPRMK